MPRIWIMSFNMELNPLLTLPDIYTNLYLTFSFSSILTNLLYLYVILVDLIELFCRFQGNIQWTACCFELIFTINAKNLDNGYSSFQTAKLVQVFMC